MKVRETIDIGRSSRGDVVKLAQMCARNGGAMADTFSRISPWSDYGVSSGVLNRYFLTTEAGAPRHEIFAGDELAGAVGVRMNWLRGPYLQFLGILPSRQGCGIGRHVMSWFEALGRGEDAENLWVMVSKINARARAFYEAHGFVATAAIPDIVVDGQIEILMRKRLSR